MDKCGWRATSAHLELAAGVGAARATRGVLGHAEEVRGMSGGKDTSQDTSRRVLIIDDDPALVALLADSLQMLGRYDVASASDGAAGLRRFFELSPDCVVVPIRMPRVNGYPINPAVPGRPHTPH